MEPPGISLHVGSGTGIAWWIKIWTERTHSAPRSCGGPALGNVQGPPARPARALPIHAASTQGARGTLKCGITVNGQVVHRRKKRSKYFLIST